MQNNSVRARVLNLVVTLTALAAVLILSGCGSSIPTGSDRDVQKAVVEIVRQSVEAKIIFPTVYQEQTGMSYPVVQLSLGRDIPPEELYQYFSVGYPDDLDGTGIAVVEETRKRASEAKIELRNIRTDSIDREIRKSTSSADLTVNGRTSPITYTAQRNAEGELFVEVFGLW